MICSLGWIGVVSTYGFIGFGKIATSCIMHPIIRWSKLYERQVATFRWVQTHKYWLCCRTCSICLITALSCHTDFPAGSRSASYRTKDFTWPIIWTYNFLFHLSNFIGLPNFVNNLGFFSKSVLPIPFSFQCPCTLITNDSGMRALEYFEYSSLILLLFFVCFLCYVLVVSILETFFLHTLHIDLWVSSI